MLVCWPSVVEGLDVDASGVAYSGCGAGEEGTHALDPLRLTVLVHGLGLSGFYVDDTLQLEHSVCAEMSTDKVCLL